MFIQLYQHLRATAHTPGLPAAACKTSVTFKKLLTLLLCVCVLGMDQDGSWEAGFSAIFEDWKLAAARVTMSEHYTYER